MEVHVTSNIDQFTKHLKEHRRQVPYAASRAINEVIRKIRLQVIADVKRRQKGGRQWWNSRKDGINIWNSHKRNLIGGVYTDMYWADLQYHGGVKDPRGRNLAIPQTATPKAYRRSGGVKRALNTKNVFINKFGVFKRFAKSIPESRWYGTHLLFRFSTKAVITPEDGVMKNFFAIAERVVKWRFERTFSKWLAEAIKTAR